jgi:L-alanine-DL-glutamate epimerase-like enolase superfamily enzyme
MRKIDSVDFFYLSMPEVQNIGDGSQDALLVRVVAGDQVGWGECEASPLVTIASLVCPMSHRACKPVLASYQGEPIEAPADIHRLHHQARQNSQDLLQADHALSGIDIALWDLLGRVYQQPTYRLLGFPRAYPKIPYFSLLFGDTPEDTRLKAQAARQQGFRAVKFGWGAFGQQGLQADIDQIYAAREGLGKEGTLFIDAGAIWDADVDEAARRLKALRACRVAWLEEPFHTGALKAYRLLSRRQGAVALAGGEGAHNEYMAMQMMDYAGIEYIQIDAGRVGGITSASRVFDHARARSIQYVNHTFTSHLSLSASLQPYAGAADHAWCEYPGQLTPLAYQLTGQHLDVDANGEIHLPELPGLGITPDASTIRQYLVEALIVVNGKLLDQPPVV